MHQDKAVLFQQQLRNAGFSGTKAIHGRRFPTVCDARATAFKQGLLQNVFRRNAGLRSPPDSRGLGQMTFFHYIGPEASLAVGLIATSAWIGLLGYGLIKLL